MAVPRYIVLQSDNNRYLSYEKEGRLKGCLRFSQEDIMNPCTKFEMEMAKTGNGLVNIRSCYNNKYWVRVSRRLHLIVAVAGETEEDVSKDSCTLFEPIFVGDDSIQFRDVKLRLFVCHADVLGAQLSGLLASWVPESPYFHRDVFKVINWESLLNLPKHVAFKGDNGRYLCSHWIDGHPYLQFASDDIGDPKVATMVIVKMNGTIQLANSSGLWRLSPNGIWTDGRDMSTDNNADAHFWPVKVDDKNTIALRNMGNNKYCKRMTTEGKRDCLNACVSTITREAKLEVKELVISRSIFNVSYRLMDARIYDKTVLTVDTQEATNNNHMRDDSMSLNFTYETKETSTWNTSLSLKLDVSFSFKTGVPAIAEQSITVGGEFNAGYQWGQIKEKTMRKESRYRVVVPPRSTVKVKLVATKSTCDVPFSYSVKDKLSSGEIITYTKDDGLYTGVNCYNFQYVKSEVRHQKCAERNIPIE